MNNKIWTKKFVIVLVACCSLVVGGFVVLLRESADTSSHDENTPTIVASQIREPQPAVKSVPAEAASTTPDNLVTLKFGEVTFALDKSETETKTN